MKKDGSSLSGRVRIDPDAAVRVSVQSKAYGRIVIDWPRRIPVRLSQAIAKLAADHVKRTAQRGEAQARRDGRAAPHLYLRLYRRGVPPETVVRLARNTLNKKDWEILFKSLGREMPRGTVKLSEVDVAICILDDEGRLAGYTQDKARECVASYLRAHGFVSTYTITLDTYRKRVKRLRSIGVKLQSV
jgi:hypothetical protein